MMKVRHVFFVILLCMLFSVTSSHAADFYGAKVMDTDVPSSSYKFGLSGFRPTVTSVTIDSPAARGGLQRGDIIVSINDKDVRKSSELRRFTTDVLAVSLFRDRERMTLTIDRPVSKSSKSKQTAAEKKSARQRQLKQETPAVVDSPPVKPDVRPVTPPATAVPAKVDIFSRPIKPSQNHIVFKNKKGEVKFSHSIHLKSLTKEQCMLCHFTDNPTHESIQSRLDNHRAAHGFCRGCHQKIEMGPTTECQTCHNYSKREE